MRVTDEVVSYRKWIKQTFPVKILSAAIVEPRSRTYASVATSTSPRSATDNQKHVRESENSDSSSAYKSSSSSSSCSSSSLASDSVSSSFLKLLHRAVEIPCPTCPTWSHFIQDKLKISIYLSSNKCKFFYKVNKILYFIFRLIVMSSHVALRTLWIPISWLLQKPADLDLHCLQES